MKKTEIKVGSVYTAKVSGKLTTVRVDAIREWERKPLYDVTNLATGRKTTFRSAAKFRSEVKHTKTVDGIAGATMRPGQLVRITTQEAEQRPDPTSGSPASSSVPTAKPSVPESSAAVPTAARCMDSLVSHLSASLKQDDADNAPHLIVEARAGTGKTTTLVEGLRYVLGGESKLTPSPQQKAVWDCMALSAGKVKTICMVAFNKAIAVELQARVPKGCDAMTMHSMGFRAVTKALGRQEPNSYVVQDIIAELLGRDIRELRRTHPILLKATEELVSLCKMNLTGFGDFRWSTNDHDWNTELSRLASHYDVDTNGSRAEVFALVPRVLERCKTPRGKISFDDMIWLPIVLNLPVYQYDLLLVDEAQDLDRCQQALAKRAGKRLVLCGDPKQAIYGFAGADSESMPRMARELQGERYCKASSLNNGEHNWFPCSADGVFSTEPLEYCPKHGQHIPCSLCKATNVEHVSDYWRCNACDMIERQTARPSSRDGRGCVTLPLTVTRRCGKAIVREAQRYVPDFEAHESNPEGVIGEARYPAQKGGVELPWEQTYAATCEPGDMVLCRVNAPLVSQCFRFLKRGIKATIQGRDVGAGLKSTVTKSKAETVVQLIAWLSEWLSKESAKEQAKRNPNEAKLIALQDRHDCLICFTEGVDTVQQVLARIESVFTDDKKSPGIRLSSIHKSKGLEARRVFLLEPEGATVPHPMSRSQWQLEQEWNLRYVAITRAIEELIYVS